LFEDSIDRPRTGGTSGRDKAIGLLVTLLFHAGLALAIIFGRFTVKVLPFGKEEVREVMIVPPLKVAIPKIVGGRDLAEVPGTGGGGAPAPAPARPAAKPEPAAPAPAAPAEAAPAEPEASLPEGGGTVPPPGSGAAIPSLSSKFQESIRVHGKSDLNLPLAPPGTPPGPPGIGAGAPLSDFSKYSRGAYFGGITGYGRGSGRGGGGGGGGGQQRVGVSIPLKGYDLLPWATKVIDKLQINWTLPAVPEVPKAARISMVVVIKKTGELDSIEIIEGTSLEPLDRAALEALRASLPFPPLPADFPGDLLEINFEFVYNE
jgi:TonB family protein